MPGGAHPVWTELAQDDLQEHEAFLEETRVRADVSEATWAVLRSVPGLFAHAPPLPKRGGLAADTPLLANNDAHAAPHFVFAVEPPRAAAAAPPEEVPSPTSSGAASPAQRGGG